MRHIIDPLVAKASKHQEAKGRIDRNHFIRVYRYPDHYAMELTVFGTRFNNRLIGLIRDNCGWSNLQTEFISSGVRFTGNPPADAGKPYLFDIRSVNHG